MTLVLGLIFERNSHQLDFVAPHMHMCFQARMADESQMAPTPQTVRYKLKRNE